MDDKKTLSSRLIRAVINNDVKLVGYLLNRGANPNSALDRANITPLHYAALNNALEVIPLLVEAGAILEAETQPEGYTAIEIAFLHGNYQIAMVLLAYVNEEDMKLH